MNVAAIKPESINSSRIAFGIAPRINAAEEWETQTER